MLAADLREIMSRHTGRVVSTTTSEAILFDLVDRMKEVVDEFGSLNLAGLGCLSLKFMPSRQARNPKTGDAYVVAEHTKVKFRESETWASVHRPGFNKKIKK